MARPNRSEARRRNEARDANKGREDIVGEDDGALGTDPNLKAAKAAIVFVVVFRSKL